jgi:GDPmannose 4,6-dehydratase
VSKLFAYWIVKNYRESYGIFAVNGILFNHESLRRGEDFVTRKITLCLADIARGRREVLEVGNLDACRDWGHAADFVDGMWRMLQVDEPEDYVLGTGEQHSVREFIEMAWHAAFGSRLRWEGTGVDERGYEECSNTLRVVVNPEFFRPAEVKTVLADPQKAFERLGWKATVSFEEIVKEMVRHDVI